MGEWPPEGMEVDHINGDTCDNRWVNLRLATHAQNIANSRLVATNTYRMKGVYLLRPPNGGTLRKPYQSKISYTENGKRKSKYLGTFATAKEAHEAYMAEAHIMRGEFVRKW